MNSIFAQRTAFENKTNLINCNMKEDFWEVIGTIISIVFWLAIGVSDVAGIVHSIKKHSVGDTVAAVALPPWGVWRGIESLWHDDYKNVDWNKQLSEDFETVLYFYDKAIDRDTDVYLLNQEVSDFADVINDYPSSKKEELMRASRAFIEYDNLITSEFISFLRSNEESSQPSWSEQIYKLENELSTYYPNISKHRSSVEVILNNLKDFDSSDVDRMSLATEMNEKKIHKMFERLFSSNQ